MNVNKLATDGGAFLRRTPIYLDPSLIIEWWPVEGGLVFVRMMERENIVLVCDEKDFERLLQRHETS